MKGHIFRRSIYFILIFLGFLGFLDTIILAIYTGINVGVLFPGTVGCILILYVAAKLWICKDRPLIENHVVRRIVCFCLAFFILFFVFMQIIIEVNSWSEDNKKTDFVIILGGGLNGDEVSSSLKERLDRGIEYLNRYPDAIAIVSGGKSFGEKIPEAQAMENYLVSKGIDKSRIIKEDRSTSTMENFKYSKQMLNQIKGKETKKIMIITSDFHMMRAKMLARRAGFEPYGITSKTPLSILVNARSREFFAIIKSYLLDR